MNWVAKIGLGTVQFGAPYGISNSIGQTPFDEVTRILDFAKSTGIEVLDTASAYGKSETVLGQNNLQGFKVISKFMPANHSVSIAEQLNQSLMKLNSSFLYGYMAHRPTDLIDNPKQWNELIELKNQCLVKKIGYSLNQPSELTTLINIGLVPDIIQVPYNYFDNRFETLISDLHKQGVEIHTRSAFLQGLFFRKPDTLPGFFNEIKSHILELQANGNLCGALLKYVIEKPFIDRVIMGVENLQQLKQNLSDVEDAKELIPVDCLVSENILMPSAWPQV